MSTPSAPSPGPSPLLASVSPRSRRPGPARPSRRTATVELVLVVGLLTAGALPFLPAFGSPAGYLAAVYATAAGTLTVLGCSALRLTALPTAAVLGLVHVLVAPWVLPDVDRGVQGVLTVLAATVTVWRDALNLPLPLSSFTDMTVLPWVTCLAVSALCTRLVIVGRDVLAGLAAVLVPLVASAWGGHTLVAPTVLGPGLASGVLMLWSVASLRQRHLRVIEAMDAHASPPGAGKEAGPGQGSGWRRLLTSRLDTTRATLRASALSVVLVATVLAVTVSVSPVPPTSRTVLRDVFEPPLSLSEYATPLSLVRTIETDLADTDLLHLSGAPKDTRLRVAALDSYDGLSARVGEKSPGISRFERIGNQTSLARPDSRHDPLPSASPATEPSQEAAVTVASYSFPWVPTLASTVRLEASGPRSALLGENLYYDAFSSTGVATAGLVTGDVLKEDVVAYTPPSESQLSTDSVAQVPLGTVDQVPSSVVALAAEIVGSESDPLAQVRALQQRLRTSYYSDGTQSPSPPGHGAARIASMVEADSLVGDDEQYSVLMMLLCRSLGIPARVVMGFNPAIDGNAADVTGQDVSAWVEIPFTSLGWVPFEVTPDRDQVPQQQTTQKVSNPEPQVLQPPLPDEDPAELPPSYEDPGDGGSEEDQRRGVPTVVLLVAGSLVLLVALLGAVVAWKALRRRRRRRRSGVALALGSWDEIVDRARDLGQATTWGATRREAAHELDPHFPHADLPRFAGAVDTQVFGAGEPTSYALGELWDSCDAIVRAMGADRSRLRRFLARLSPRSLVHPAGQAPRRRPLRRS